jgi:DNA-binding response OmpR family regulator
VLVVDDDASLRLLCRINLELDGYNVLEAASVGEAKDLLGSEQVTLLLLDIHVGRESGLDLMRSLREREGSPPVVLLTGSAQLDSVARGEADGIVPKPFQLDELLSVVHRLAGR